jgi:hypothetical protein
MRTGPLTEEQKQQRRETRLRNEERKQYVRAVLAAQRAEQLKAMGERAVLYKGREAIRIRIVELGYRALALAAASGTCSNFRKQNATCCADDQWPY